MYDLAQKKHPFSVPGEKFFGDNKCMGQIIADFFQVNSQKKFSESYLIMKK